MILIVFYTSLDDRLLPILHCKNCGVLCPPNEQHTIGVISHRPRHNPPYLVCKSLVRHRRVITPNGLVCFEHRIWCARFAIGVTAHF